MRSCIRMQCLATLCSSIQQVGLDRGFGGWYTCLRLLTGFGVLTARLRGGDGGWPDRRTTISNGQEQCCDRASTLALDASTWMTYNQGFFPFSFCWHCLWRIDSASKARTLASPTTCLHFSSGRREVWETCCQIYPSCEKRISTKKNRKCMSKNFPAFSLIL